MQKKYFFLFLTIFIALISWYALRDIANSVLVGLIAGLTPVVIAFFIAYLLDHAVSFFEKVYFFAGVKTKINHILSILSGVLSIALVIGIIFAILIPAIVENALTFSQNLDFYKEKLLSITQDIQNYLSLPSDLDLSSIFNSIDQTAINDALSGLLSSSLSALSTLSISLLLSFTILLEKNNIKKALNLFVNKVFSSPDKVKNGFYCAKIVLDGYLYGKLLECAIVGGLCLILFICCSLPYAVFFALLCALLYIFPYVGGYIALVPPCLVALTISTPVFLITLIGGVVILNVVGTFISPLIYKNSMNISALTIMSSIIIGGSIAGVVGFLCAPPVAGVIKLFLSATFHSKKDKRAKKD